ncbi:PEP-CTERM protein-sorting domain-containing protein [Duganella sacchari]|uniref:PEP-CTERM protein-sorting domain-containing protein n=1 Tax=Duganella sacchari TaxID=551987 RepID=A0A1M7R0B0_9BURK|nr:hypothetical protein [Duganella sacchari]SHN38097.1 PEP-CTERM protein-sorting domain-containing protein [Duganella sacchari]
MKKILAMFLLAAGVSAGAYADTIQLTPPPGFTGGTYGDFTYSGSWTAIFDSPFVSFYEGQVSVLTYDSGTMNLKGLSLNGRPWNGYNDTFPFPVETPNLTLTFKGIGGNVLSTKSLHLADDDRFIEFASEVQGVHSIEFSAPASQFFVRVASVSMVPEAEAYAMLLAGLSVLAALRRKQR